MSRELCPKNNARTLIGKRQMHPEVMEVIADVLLACHAERNPDCPTYTERQLLRKCRKAASLPEGFTYGSAEVDSDELFNIEMSLVSHHTRMSSSEKRAWQLYAIGYNFKEIAKLMGVSQPTAVRFVRSAARRADADDSRYKGLRSVYRQETRKYIYHKPKHCDERHCEKLGYCRFALRGKSIFEEGAL
ncbi:MAG: hypothetical protein K6T99_09400 [Armatimonadetes bacterium]|nr:hypothetical protein [Armatimonadota bacterium]